MAAAATSLHQLPSPPADFTGRKAELTELRAAVRKGGATISGVQGTGGIGKTALALKLAQQLAPRYPDAQLYLDLKGVSQQPLTAAQAMAHVIRAYQPAAQLPEGEEALGGVYRSVLHDQLALLLMDNAAGPAQVEPLIPPAGCLLLVTSRFHFTLPGLFAKDLDELPEEDARLLLAKIAPRIGAAAGEIARLCGCLPIALRLAGGALAERPWLSPAEYAHRLGDAKEGLGLIEGALRTSYDLLTEELQALWRTLAVLPGTFDAAAAAAVWEREPRPAEEALGELAQSSLVDWEPEEEGEAQTGRYRLHDLARVFAEARLSAEEREMARRRHAAHFVEVLWAAEGLYHQGGDALLKGLGLFDREWGNVQAGQAWAAVRVGEDESAARLCSAYPGAGAYLLPVRQLPRERAGWLEAAVAAARRRNDRAAEGRHLGNLGTSYLELGETQRAIEHFEQSLAIVREIGDRRSESNALGNLGLAYAVLGETRRAIEHFKHWLAIAREIGDRRLEGAALGNLGNIYTQLGEMRRAIEYHEEALAIDQEIGDRRAESQDLGNLGNAYAYLGEIRRAIELYEQDLAIAREIGDRSVEASTSWNLGLVLKQEGELARAAGFMQVRVDYERSIGHPDAEEHAARLATLRARIAVGS
ncbi:MAG TPA: tetratricopeptide repeat protein [Thermoanaerobaculia bacterium]|nr:tetratricopeptide repeat protein [Thermoanaerobaculia bacterium]